MQHMLSVSFYIQRQRLNDKKEAPIVIRLKLQSKTRDISAGLRVNPANWNSKFGAVKGTREAAKQTNKLLTALKNKLLKIFSQLIYAGEVSIDDVVDEFHGKDQLKDHTLLKLVVEHNERINKRIGIDYTKSTYEKYLAMEVRVRQYVKEHLNNKDIPVKHLDRKFISNFFLYLKEIHKNQHNSATKTTKNLKRVLSYSVEQGYLDQNPFNGYKCGYRKQPARF
jgi:integrase/recombinase XerD